MFDLLVEPNKSSAKTPNFAILCDSLSKSGNFVLVFKQTEFGKNLTRKTCEITEVRKKSKQNEFSARYFRHCFGGRIRSDYSGSSETAYDLHLRRMPFGK